MASVVSRHHAWVGRYRLGRLPPVRSTGRYPSIVDEQQPLQFPVLEFFWQTLPPGVMEVDDVSERDWQKEG